MCWPRVYKWFTEGKTRTYVAHVFISSLHISWVVAKNLATLSAMSRCTHTHIHIQYVIDLSFGCSLLSCSVPGSLSVSIKFKEKAQNLKMLHSDPIHRSSITLLEQMWMVLANGTTERNSVLVLAVCELVQCIHFGVNLALLEFLLCYVVSVLLWSTLASPSIVMKNQPTVLCK